MLRLEPEKVQPAARPRGRGFATANHLIVCSNFRASPNKSLIRWRSAMASWVNRPCRRALWFPFCAPEPCAPPCMRQRDLPRTAAERHDPPERVLAPQRGLVSIGRIFGAGLLKLVLSARGLSRPGNRARSFVAAGQIQLRCQGFRVWSRPNSTVGRLSAVRNCRMSSWCR